MKQKIGRKLLSFLLTLVMVIGLLPGMVLTVYADDPYNLKVGGTEVTSANASDVFSDSFVSYYRSSRLKYWGEMRWISRRFSR